MNYFLKIIHSFKMTLRNCIGTLETTPGIRFTDIPYIGDPIYQGWGTLLVEFNDDTKITELVQKISRDFVIVDNLDDHTLIISKHVSTPDLIYKGYRDCLYSIAEIIQPRYGEWYHTRSRPFIIDMSNELRKLLDTDIKNIFWVVSLTPLKTLYLS